MGTIEKRRFSLQGKASVSFKAMLVPKKAKFGSGYTFKEYRCFFSIDKGEHHPGTGAKVHKGTTCSSVDLISGGIL
jgi:hypothetical protein